MTVRCCSGTLLTSADATLHIGQSAPRVVRRGKTGRTVLRVAIWCDGKERESKLGRGMGYTWSYHPHVSPGDDKNGKIVHVWDCKTCLKAPDVRSLVA